MKSYYRWIKRNAVILCLLLFIGIFCVFRLQKSDIKVLQFYKKNDNAVAYSITYHAATTLHQQQEIENLVNDIEAALDYYSLDAEVSLFNHHYDSEPFTYRTAYFYPILTKIKAIHSTTQGAFDPTVAPYITLWKAHQKVHSEPSQEAIWAISPAVSLDYMVVNQTRVKKLKEDVTININNLISSFQADTLADYVQEKEIRDFCIELEDAVVTRGIPSKKGHWRIVKQIAHPELEKPLKIHIDLGDSAMAVIDNSKSLEDDELQAICIDPLTGDSIPQHFLIACVFAEDCVTAKGYATALMTQNFEHAFALTAKADKLDFVVIERDETINGGIKYRHSAGVQVIYKEGATKVQVKHIGNSATISADDKPASGIHVKE
jgi:thiamine biosynthesis lipoprotein